MIRATRLLPHVTRPPLQGTTDCNAASHAPATSNAPLAYKAPGASCFPSPSGPPYLMPASSPPADRGAQESPPWPVLI